MLSGIHLIALWSLAAPAKPDPAPHACVPIAACLALSYLGEPTPYQQVAAECSVDPDGSTPVSDLMAVCRKRGMYASAFDNVSLIQLQCWLDEGFAVVAIPTQPGKNHALSMFGSKLFVADLITPLHEADQGRLNEHLKAGMVCVVIGQTEPPVIRWWLTGAVLGTSLLLIGQLVFSRRQPLAGRGGMSRPLDLTQSTEMSAS